MTNYKHLDIDVVNELKAVNEVADLENIVDELAGFKMSLLSVPCADNELQDVRAEIIDGMEKVVKWINDRLETGFYDYDTCEELREYRYYMKKCIIELQYMVKHSIKVHFQIHEWGKRWEDIPVKTMTVQALNEDDCKGIAYMKMKELSLYEEKEIRFTYNDSSQGKYIGHQYTFAESKRRKEQQQ
ncbi:hypothetical protein PQE74_gp007 [Bacillus phage vB_BanS_Chewbecca]|uniref:Uncharacterized protein n=1 Tax=Bacillus phage vB_BanS_Chewbecca TaxID=2894786 RepID=A0AAE9CAS7_9CAUD|nr:hypothetical protein PQE74_gp007 [Bacillus phage vB_BanS_Chewbecca]UGO46090.1 hypothetical protein CHEWBECCA_7 [Bacillus phage vB_BanS_Chewbecca]